MSREIMGIGPVLLLVVTIVGCSASPKAETDAAGDTADAVSANETIADVDSPDVRPEPEIVVETLEMTDESPAEPEYVIQEGDLLGIKFFFNPELNEEVTVRPDGRISLQLVPEIAASGRTPSELTRELKERYSQELDSPEISVIVRSFSAQRVFVDGEVDQPGELDLIDGLTVLGAIARAEGLTDRGQKEAVVIIRRGEGGAPKVAEFNLQKIRKGLASDPMLAPYDVVFVPMKKIANLNLWMDQYIRGNIPVSFGFRLDIDELND